MSWHEKATLGQEFVAAVHDLLRVNDTYVMDSPTGFTYWAGDFATRVETDIGIFRQSVSIYRVTAETEFIKGKGHMEELATALEGEMDQCTFSGPVYDAPSDTFRLFCGVYAASDQAVWLKRTFAAAVALQIAEAHELARRLSQKFHVAQAASAHPQSGFRTIPDPVLANAGSFFQSTGDQPSKWEGVPTWEQAGWMMEREARHFDTDRQTYMHADFDWVCGEDPLTLDLRTNEPHPKLGNGLHVTLTVPMRLSPQAIGHLLLDLNTYEKSEYKRCHTLGSWCNHNGKLAFREFIPNALFDEDYLEDVCVSMCTRAIWTNEWFYEKKCQAEAARAAQTG